MNNFLLHSIEALVNGIKDRTDATQDEAENMAALMIRVSLFSQSNGFKPGIAETGFQRLLNSIRGYREVITALNPIPQKTEETEPIKIRINQNVISLAKALKRRREGGQ
ncbi:hypothetical protein [Nodularia spumigena]|uniref:hypothetical protein n=1 Tax=Nodularia spumigena TaxID=70799 RepID=UPI00232CFD5D|nr:hypothetical protein [Nodularia spumigena]